MKNIIIFVLFVVAKNVHKKTLLIPTIETAAID